MNDTIFDVPLDLVLGMQAESLFKAYIERSKYYELLASNIQIQGERETLGEMDYILRNLISHKTTHVELACKFYLYDTSAGFYTESKWIGPNRKDSLYDKLEKTKWRQFPIIQKEETIATLKNLNLEIPTVQELCLKAFLFIPMYMKLQEIPSNFKECITGYWMRPIDFEKEDPTALYAIPQKKEWLLPVDQIGKWYSFQEVQSILHDYLKNQKSPLIYKKTSHGTERFFVVWW